MCVFYSQMLYLSISSVTFCRFPHNQPPVLYISEKVPAVVIYCTQNRCHYFHLLRLLFYYKEWQVQHMPTITAPDSSLPALWFLPTAPAFSHRPKRMCSRTLHGLSPLLESPVPLSPPPLSPHVALLRSSLCPKMPPPIGKHLPKRCKNNARHKNKAQAETACALFLCRLGRYIPIGGGIFLQSEELSNATWGRAG